MCVSGCGYLSERDQDEILVLLLWAEKMLVSACLCMSPVPPQPQLMLPWQISPGVGIIFLSVWRAFAHPGPHSDPAPAHICNLFTSRNTYNPLCIHRLTCRCHISPCCSPSVTGFTNRIYSVYILYQPFMLQQVCAFRHVDVVCLRIYLLRLQPVSIRFVKRKGEQSVVVCQW